MNLDKILQRIRLLFKESYIYEKSSLVAALVQIKQYPLDQIYTALNYLITEKNEYLTDMLGRLGRLVNIGKFYMFTPVEINPNDHLTRFEREVPIDFKRDGIVFNLPEKIPDYKNPINIEGNTIDMEVSDTIYNIIEKQSQDLIAPNIIDTEYKEDWAKSAAWAIKNLHKYNGFDKKMLVSLAIDHLIDVLPFSQKVQLLQYITKNKDDSNDFNKNVSNYFNNYIINTPDWKGIVLADFSKSSKKSAYTVLTWNREVWVDDKEAIARADRIRPLFEKFQIKDIDTVNDVIGFMVLFKGQLIVFKTKELQLSEKGRTNKGSRCDRGEGKGVVIKRLNSLLSKGLEPIKYKMKKSSIDSIYGDKDIKQKIKFGKKTKEVKITGLQLCIESELLLRYYDNIKKNDKRWFFNTVSTLINNVVKLGRQ